MTSPEGEMRKFESAAEVARVCHTSTNTITNWLKGKSLPNGAWKNYEFTYFEGEQFTDYETDQKGKITPSSKNIKNWLKIHFDDFASNEWTGMLEIDGTPISDEQLDVICVKMEDEIGINNDKKTRQCITDLCLENPYHPVKDRIESLEWDGKPRAESIFIDFIGAHDNELNRFYTRCWLKAAIKRLYEPGCMWDSMIILYDTTGGTGKTKILERLSLGYYAQDPDVGNKDAINIMNTAWLINFDELNRFDKKSMNELKTFLTVRAEVNRLAYARYAKEYKRHCIFCGTTNEEYFLRDYTSLDRERRFWIINCSGTRKPDGWWSQNLPEEYINQVWAEVKHWYDEDPNISTNMSLQLQDDERMVQMAHKSYNNDPEFVILVKQVLSSRYSKNALENYNAFKKEVYSTETDSARVIALDKIEVKKIAAVLKKPENYTALTIANLGGWIIRDGFAVRSNQYELDV